MIKTAYEQCQDCIHNIKEYGESILDCDSEGIRSINELKLQKHCAAQQTKPVR